MTATKHTYTVKYISLLFIISMLSCAKKSNIPLIPETPPLFYDTYTKCIEIGDNNKLEVATWNIEHFPKGETTINEVSSIISYSDYDVWAIQEIEQESAIKQITKLDKGYSVLLDTDIKKGINRNYHLAFVYRNDFLELLDSDVLSLNPYYFPRRPLLAKFRRKKDKSTFYIINNHLKAMGDSESESRRKGASKEIKKYIDDNLSNEKVIVLGDFNDVIYPYSKSEFQNILDDTDNYKFADMQIATCSGSDCEYSYPGYWNSHIDHILITNELFSSLEKSKVLALDNCSSNYDDNVSDHRPVVAIFN